MTNILTQLAVDDPLVQDAAYRFDSKDRQYIDEQIRGIETHLVNCLVKGKQATFFRVDATSVALVAGNVVCAYGTANGEITVGLATTTPVATAGGAIGIVLVAANPGGYVLVAFAGVVPPSVTGLATGTAGYAVLNKTTGILAASATFTASDVVLGKVDPSGNVNVYQVPTAQIGTANPGGTGSELQYRLNATTFGAASNFSYNGTGIVGTAAGFCSFGTIPSAAGYLRFPGPSVAYTLASVKNTSAVDTPIIRFGTGDTVVFGNNGQDVSLVSTINGFVAFGASVPATGKVKFAYAATDDLVTAKDSTAADRKVISRYAADSYLLGDATINTFNWTWNAYAATVQTGAGGFVVTAGPSNSAAIVANGTSLFVGTNAAYAAQHTDIRTYAASSVNFGIGSTTYATVNSATASVEFYKTPGGLVVSPDLNGLRLTVTTGQPLPTADVATASTIYLTPYRSGSVSLYTGGLWYRRDTAEISLALTALTTGKNYDVFAYWTGSAVALELGPAWTTDTARSTSLALQDGVWTKSGDATRRYVGTIRAISATQTTDTATQRFVYNEYNQFRRHLMKTEATATWTYALTTVRQTNGATANKVEVVVGNPSEIEVSAVLLATAGASGIRPIAGIGIDSTTVSSGISFGDASSTAFASETNQVRCEYDGVLTAGYHAINWLESIATASSETLYGTSGGSTSFLRARLRL